MTNKEILELYKGLDSCGELSGVKFVFAVAKNAQKLRVKVDTFNKVTEKLQDEHAEKNKKGEKILEGKNVKMKDLGKYMKDYNELLDLKEKVTLHTVVEKDVPKEITAGQLTAIMPIIK